MIECMRSVGAVLGFGLFGGAIGTGVGALAAKVLQIDVITGLVHGVTQGGTALLIGKGASATCGTQRCDTKALVGTVAFVASSGLSYGVLQGAGMKVGFSSFTGLVTLTSLVGLTILIGSRFVKNAWDERDCCRRALHIRLSDVAEGDEDDPLSIL